MQSFFLPFSDIFALNFPQTESMFSLAGKHFPNFERVNFSNFTTFEILAMIYLYSPYFPAPFARETDRLDPPPLLCQGNFKIITFNTLELLGNFYLNED